MHSPHFSADRHMVVLCVVGARPNFVKMAPLLKVMNAHPELDPVLVHTEQHASNEMSGTFFQELGIPPPAFSLGIGSGSHAEQTARAMVAFERVVLERRPDLVLLVGDVNSTLACALAAAKLQVRVAHVEAGLRSFDRSMPEEINRVLTDQLSDFLFTTSSEAGANLQREGIPEDRVHFVGNVMIDTLIQHLPAAQERAAWRRWPLEPSRYAVLTLHRPSNVDDRETLHELLGTIERLQQELPIVFPVHPRTQQRFRVWDIDKTLERLPHLFRTEPLGYVDFLSLLCRSRVVLTDSGGLQEESAYLGIPCLTLRENTERPVTVGAGTNVVVGLERQRILGEVRAILNGRTPVPHTVPPLWDGQAAQRILAVLRRALVGDASLPTAVTER